MITRNGFATGSCDQAPRVGRERGNKELASIAALKLLCSVLSVLMAVLLAFLVGSQKVTLHRDDIRNCVGGACAGQIVLSSTSVDAKAPTGPIERLSHESLVPVDDRTMQIFRKIWDLESLQRNIEECYQTEARTLAVSSLSRQTVRPAAELDGELVARVFKHLTGTPEHERFLAAYRALAQDPDHRLYHAEELYAEYLALLESCRRGLIQQLRERSGPTNIFVGSNHPRGVKGRRNPAVQNGIAATLKRIENDPNSQ